MKQPRINRRQFFKLSAFSVAAAAGLPAIGIAAIAAAPSKEAIAAAEQPHAPAIPQPTFNPISSNTTFGPLTDISMGWDGTLWGIDAQGAPHVYDEINKVWAQHGDSIDAAALSGDSTTIYLFQGPNVVPVNAATMTAGAPTTIAALWPTLPDSFKLGVNGAMTSRDGNGLILFNGGRYISTDGTVPLGKLSDLPGWPTTGVWTNSVTVNGVTKTDGVIDAAFNTIEVGVQVLQRAGQAMRVVISQADIEVWTPPEPFASFVNRWFDSGMASWVSSGGSVDAMTMGPGGSVWPIVFKGTSALIVSSPSATPQYIGKVFNSWPATWHPVLQHAPNGRDGNLWSVLPPAQGSWIVQHNGDSWTRVNNQADHVGVGQDNTVMIASAQKLWKFTGALDGTGFTAVSPASNLIQVSLGHANAVFARDNAGNVYSFNPSNGALTQNASVSANGGASHIATTGDGTLWHAKPNSPNAHRYLSNTDVIQNDIPIKSGVISTVSKVAATGFGAAHCLATDTQGNTQALRYDSPYIFQSPKTYLNSLPYGKWVEQGAGLIFLADVVDISNNPTLPDIRTQVVALDAHTGVEVARAPILPAPLLYGQPVFDPIHNLVYVGASPEFEFTNNTTAGQMLALDARTLAVKWSFTTTAGVDAPAVLNGGRLCFGDRAGKFYMIDTAAALANPASVQTLWTVDIASKYIFNPPINADTHRIPTPAFVTIDGIDWVFSAIWYLSDAGNGTWNVPVVLSVKLNAVDGSSVFGSAGDGFSFVDPRQGFNIQRLDAILSAPMQGTCTFKGNDQNGGASPIQPAVIYNIYNRVFAINIGIGSSSGFWFPLPAGDFISTGFAYDNGRSAIGGLTTTPPAADAGSLWFGTQQGVLYCLNSNLSPTNYTPYNPALPNSFIYTTPVIYKDTAGGTTVLYNAFQNGDPNAAKVIGFDPDNGNVAALPTGATIVTTLSKGAAHGVVYCYGIFAANNAGLRPQAFGLRIDQLPQAERDFIIESQLMQDAQNPGGAGGSTVTAPDGNVIPPSVARYQTHLAVVDDKKHPQANEPVKIWADVDGTVITVDGAQYTVGPADTAYAGVKTGADGSLVIMSDAKDVNTSALRVWAAFMDPFERIMVYPDHEWHGRAAQSNANGTVTDANKPNLNTAYSYKPDASTPGSTTPKPLFTDSEKTQGTPTNVANAVGQMNTGLNPGGNSAASVAGALKTLHASNPAAPYVAYTTLGGMHYGPNNARAKRTATIAAPFGFALNKPKGGTHTYTPLTHSDARSAIDALDGKPWDPNNPNGTAVTSEVKPMTFVIRRGDDLFTDFWNWLKGVVADIENVIVSVADDIMVGINFIVNGIKQAFKAIIKVIEDVVNAIGSFFLQLAKLIEEIIEALSVLFHFGEIIWTHNWLKGVINQQMAGLKDSILNYVKTPFDSFIGSTEDAIKEQFAAWRAQISGQNMSDVQGGQSSMHSTFTVKDSSGASSSQGVVAGAHNQKLKGSISSSGGAGSAAQTAGGKRMAAPLASQDVITDFVNGFINRITGDGDLKDAFAQLQSDFSNLFQPQSGSQFFATALTTLLDILETLLIGLIAVAGAFIDGMIGVIDALISAAQDAMNAPLDIPFFSWLYKLVFGSDLTILDLVALVAAIPATMIFKVVQGAYPSQSGLPDPATMANGSTPATQSAGAMSPQEVEAAQDILSAIRALVGVGNGICIFAAGIMQGAGDVSDDLPAWVGKLSFATGIIITCLSIPLIYTTPDKVSKFDWVSYGCAAFIAFASGFGVLASNPTTQKILSAVLSFQNICCLAYVIFAYIEDKATDKAAQFGFAGNIGSVLPGILNPLKYLLGVPGEVIVIFADVVGYGIWGATSIASAFAYINAATRQRRLFFPFIANGLANPRAIPFAGGTTP